MAFFRIRAGKNGAQYLYKEERWREGKRVRSKSRYIGRVGGGSSPGVLVPALPFMILHELATGNRIEQLKAARAAADKAHGRGRGMPHSQYAPAKFNDSDRQRAFDSIVNSPKTPTAPGFKSNGELVAALEAKEASKSGGAQAPANDKEADGKEGGESDKGEGDRE